MRIRADPDPKHCMKLPIKSTKKVIPVWVVYSVSSDAELKLFCGTDAGKPVFVVFSDHSSIIEYQYQFVSWF